MRFGFIGDILRWLLDLIYGIIPNYGVAILIFVFIIMVFLSLVVTVLASVMHAAVALREENDLTI